MIRPPIRVTLQHFPATSMAAAIFFLAVLVQGGTASSVTIEVLYAPNDAPLDRLVALYQIDLSESGGSLGRGQKAG